MIAVVVGISVGMEGGAAGVQLLVPDDCVEAALTVLQDAWNQREKQPWALADWTTSREVVSAPTNEVGKYE